MIGQSQRTTAWLRAILSISFVLTLTTAYHVNVGQRTVQAATLAQSGKTTLGVVGLEAATLYDAPEGKSVGTLESSAIVTALGRNDDSSWLFVRGEDGKTGWTPAISLVIFDVESLPTVEPGDEAAVAPQPTRVAAPTATPTSAPPTPTIRPTQPPRPTATPTTPATAVPAATATTAAASTTASGSDAPANSNSSTTTQSAAPGGVALLGVIGGNGAQLVDEPGAGEGRVLLAGTTVTLLGRSADSGWLYLQTESGGTGWVAVDRVVAFGLDQLAEVQPGDQPATNASASSASPTSAVSTTTESAAASTTSTTVTNALATATVRTNGGNLNVRGGPGTNYSLVAKVSDGASLPVLARNDASTWLQVAVNGGNFGWVSASFVTLDGVLADLPVSDAISAPVLPPTPTVVAAAPSNSASTVTSPAAPVAAPAASTASGLSGQLVIATGGGGTIYLYNLATGELRGVTNGYDPDINRTSSLITFARAGGENGVYVINPDGSGQRKMFGGSELLASPKFSPDGSKVVFVRVSGVDSCRDLGFVCLPDEPEFSGLPLATNPTFGLARVKVDDKEYRDIATVGNTIAPDWNESGIIYRATRGFKITADKTPIDVKTMTLEHGWQDPDWQPGGDRVVFQVREGDHWEIHIANSDGSGDVALTRPQTTFVPSLPSNVAPAWSPDGTQIVFLSSRDASGAAGAWGVWVMNPDGSNQRRLPVELPIRYGFAQEQMVGWGR